MNKKNKTDSCDKKNKIQIEAPNAETIEAIKEVEAMKKDESIGKTYESVDEMIRDILDV